MPCTKPASIPEIPKTWGTASTAQRGQITPGAAVVEDGSTPKTTNHVMITALADMMMLPVGARGPEDGVLAGAAVFGPEWQQGASSGICLEAEIEGKNIYIIFFLSRLETFLENNNKQLFYTS